MKRLLFVCIICVLTACKKEEPNSYFKLLSYDNDTLALVDSISYFNCSFETDIYASFSLIIRDSAKNLYSKNSYINYGDDIVMFNPKILIPSNVKGYFYWNIKSNDNSVTTETRSFFVN
jgi:hypothetical protein